LPWIIQLLPPLPLKTGGVKILKLPGEVKMTSTVGSISPPVQNAPSANMHHVQRAGTDSDGDNDGSKPGEAEKAATPKPVSATIGNFINIKA
jgi:hypothetical protein